MHDLQQLLAERPELHEQIAALAREMSSTSRGRSLDDAESQEIVASAWRSPDDVPDLLTADQARQAMHEIGCARAKEIAEANSMLEQFERSYADSICPYLTAHAKASQELTDAKSDLREAEKAVAEARRVVAESRGRLSAVESELSRIRSTENSNRMKVQSESRSAKSSAELKFIAMSRAIAAARKRYETELSAVRSVAKEETSRMNKERRAIEDAIIRRKASKKAAEVMEDMEDMEGDESQGHGVSIPGGNPYSDPLGDSHPLLDEQGGDEGSQDGEATVEHVKPVPWEELAAECEVKPLSYGDWIENYFSGWGNAHRIKFAKKRILARRVGAEVPEWPEELRPGKYLGRAPLTKDQERFYTDVPPEKIVASPKVIH